MGLPSIEPDIDSQILGCLEDWKSVPQIVKELNVNTPRAYKRIKRLDKMGMLQKKYAIDCPRKAPMLYRKVEGEN